MVCGMLYVSLDGQQGCRAATVPSYEAVLRFTMVRKDPWKPKYVCDFFATVSQGNGQIHIASVW